MNKEAANALYTGIVTDTGRFLYRGVDSILMHATADLLDFDVDIDINVLSTILITKT